MQKLVLTLWVFLIFNSAFAQEVAEGVVKDAETGALLVGATVVANQTGDGTLTDAEGSFKIEVESIPAELKISYVGYQTQIYNWKGESNFEVNLAPQQMEEVIIKGIRGTERTPVTQKTVSKKEIEEIYIGQDALFLAERLTPSIVAYSESGTNYTNYGQMRLRGIDQTRINITLDGVPLNDMIDQGVFFSNFTDFGNSVESFQVQRGVGTSTNGTASYAGSINYESIELNRPEPSVELQLNSGSFNTWRGSAEVHTGRMDNDFAFYSRISMIHSDGYKYHSGTDSYSFFFSGAHFGEKDVFKLTGFKGQSQNELAYLPVAESIIQDDPRTNPLSPNDVDDFGQWMLKLEHTHIFNNQLSIASTAYYGGAGGSFPFGYDTQDILYTGDTNDPADTVSRFTQINYPLQNDHFGILSNISWNSRDESLTLNGGVHAYTFHRNNQEQIVPDYNNPYYDESSRKDEISAFVKTSYQAGGFNFYGDLQMRSVKMTIEPDEAYLGFPSDDIVWDWFFLNPRVGVNYQLNTENSVYASFGRSGREPTKVDIFGGFQLTADNYPFVTDQNSVQPEFVNDLEIGYRLQKSNLRILANFFYMGFDNEIAPIGETVVEGFVQLRKNVPESYRTGLEIDWDWNAMSWLSFRGNLTYMDSEIATYAPDDEQTVYENVTPVLSPEWIGNGTLAFRVTRDLTIDVTGRLVSESFLEPTNDPNFVMPGFFVLDSRISYQMGKHSFSLALNNLTDELYYTYGVPVGNEPGYLVQPPFNIFGTLIVRF
jgi:iron complex outermembrane receptor protein